MGFAGRLPLALSLLASAWSLRSREGPPPQTLFAEPPAGYTFQRFEDSEDGKSACGLFHFETKADITQHDVVVAVATYAGRHEMMRSKHYPFHTQQLPPGALLVYFTNSAMEGRMISAPDNSTDTSYQAAQDRFMHVWRFVASDCLGTGRIRWFLMLDDDAVVSFGRLGIFMRAFEKTVGDPLKQQQLLGRTTTWMKRPEVFGGNGILATGALMQALGKLPGSAWSKAVSDTIYDGQHFYYDATISMLVRGPTFPANVMRRFLSGPFGIKLWLNNVQDQVNRVLVRCGGVPRSEYESCMSFEGSAKLAITLHKVKTPATWEAASYIFSKFGTPKVSDYSKFFVE